MVTKYRIKPIVVSAIEWTGNNIFDMAEFTDGFLDKIEGSKIYLHTLSGIKVGLVGDYIIRDNDGNFDICDSYMFEKNYERHNVWDENL